MAYKREIFKKIGGFRNWLGPGSIGANAEDAEFSLRALIKGYKILYNPRVKLYHNRWLTGQEFKTKSLSYSCGELACYGYFALQGQKFAKEVVAENFKDSFWKLRRITKRVLLGSSEGPLDAFFFFKELASRLWGLLVAIYFVKREPL